MGWSVIPDFVQQAGKLAEIDPYELPAAAVTCVARLMAKVFPATDEYLFLGGEEGFALANLAGGKDLHPIHREAS